MEDLRKGCKGVCCCLLHLCPQQNLNTAGLLKPLTLPSRPWSHIALEFVTGLLASSGKSVILSIIDRFSKSAHFVALEKLPSAAETAQLMVDHVFRLHGILSEITSDWGPQFVSQVWNSFCTALGARVNLSSRHHQWPPTARLNI